MRKFAGDAHLRAARRADFVGGKSRGSKKPQTHDGCKQNDSRWQSASPGFPRREFSFMANRESFGSAESLICQLSIHFAIQKVR
jgi:hypothetical protein